MVRGDRYGAFKLWTRERAREGSLTMDMTQFAEVSLAG